MNTKALKTLEYDKIIELLAKHATCGPGRQLCADLLPVDSIDEINSAQDETTDAASRIRMKGRLSFGDVKELGDSLIRLDVGASLSMPELLRISSLLSNTSRAITYGKHVNDEEPFDSLEGYFAALDDIPQLNRRISSCIVSEDEMADDASPALKDIRRKHHVLTDRMHGELNGILNSHREYLMDPVIAIRDSCYCLPVRIEYKLKVPGVVHDTSSTGSTVFIEPMAVIRINNELKELEAAEKAEIARILDELSTEAAPYRDVLASDLKLMSHLDFVFAKAAFSSEIKGSRPIVNTSGIIDLKDARHPLLPAKSAVPVSIKLGDTYDLLVITGPNTGGKTVSLKTVGLLSIMAQAGLHIPAFETSRTTVFTEIFADIGDEQSIEQSLSTFSGHMTNIVSILEQADYRSLCLFDELGAGTDPTEGAALAISILSYLHKRHIRTMATTHYSELKVFALTTPGVENASCEFDVETLRPTYRILMGIPGRSNAFAISRKLGLPQFIIDDAGNRIEKNDAAFEDLISKLNADRAIIEKERAAAEKYRLEAEAFKARQVRKDEHTLEQKEKILREAREEAQRILSDAKDTADSTIRSINKIAQDSGLSKALEKERERLRKDLKQVEGSMAIRKAPAAKAASDKPLKLRKGDRVHVISMNVDGTVSSLPNDKGYFFVQMGILRSQVHVSDIYLLDEPAVSDQKSASGAYSSRMKSASISPEINVIGKNVDEACAELDKYLDDAILAHLNSVRIIHGRGTGALKSGIHSYLKKQHSVKKYYSAAFDDGGDAITIVEFR